METIPRVQTIQTNRPYVETKPPRLPFFLRMARLGFSTLGRIFPQKAGDLAFRLFITPRKRARHKVSDEILEQAEVFDFPYNQGSLKGYQWGTGQQIVLLVHGWESRGTALRSFVPGLLELGYKVVTFDAPAHGDSSFEQTTLPHFAGAIKEIINRLGGVHAVIAHSFGGACTVYALSTLDKSIELDKMVAVACPSNFKSMFTSFLKMIQAPPKVVDRFEQKIEENIHIPIDQADVTKLYPKVKIKEILVVHDENDLAVPFAQGQLIAQTAGNSQMLVSKGWGHFALMKNKEIIDHVTRFIDEN